MIRITGIATITAISMASINSNVAPTTIFKPFPRTRAGIDVTVSNRVLSSGANPPRSLLPSALNSTHQLPGS